jgi:hypothetical protein
MSSNATKSVSKSTSAQTEQQGYKGVEHQGDTILTKTLRMVEVLKKYPKPAK